MPVDVVMMVMVLVVAMIVTMINPTAITLTITISLRFQPALHIDRFGLGIVDTALEQRGISRALVACIDQVSARI